MNRKLKLALAALLGFSAACSSVKNAPQESKNKQKSDEVVAPARKGEQPRVVVMYGVRAPEGKLVVTPSNADSLRKSPAKAQIPELDPVVEKIED